MVQKCLIYREQFRVLQYPSMVWGMWAMTSPPQLLSAAPFLTLSPCSARAPLHGPQILWEKPAPMWVLSMGCRGILLPLFSTSKEKRKK